MVKIAIMGYGIVGSGVAEILTKHKKNIDKKTQNDLELKYILDIRDFEGDKLSRLLIKDFNIILNDLEINIVVEAMGGLKPAYEFTKKLLFSGKSVVTSNKELVATHGAELLKIAYENNANYLFEASVGGGIPIIRPLVQCLAANEILAVSGILNGTTNYILTKMLHENQSFEIALTDAQSKGYAENNPASDVEGHDTCRKICILASLAFGKHIYPENVHTEGITKITVTDIKIAYKNGYTVKLLGRIKHHFGGKLFIAVTPCLIHKESPLYNVHDVFNAVLFNGDSTGEVMFYGKGAGKLPTASAVVADIIDCAKHLHARKWIFWEDSPKENNLILDFDMVAEPFFIRISGNIPAKSDIKQIFGEVSYLESDEKNNLAFITKAYNQKQLDGFLKELKTRGEISVSAIRVDE